MRIKCILKKLKKSMLRSVKAMALIMIVQNMNSACVWILHQPEVPEEAKKLKSEKICLKKIL